MLLWIFRFSMLFCFVPGSWLNLYILYWGLVKVNFTSTVEENVKNKQVANVMFPQAKVLV